MVKIWGPIRSTKVTDHFTSISVNVSYCITCTLFKKIYIGEKGRRLPDHFRKHLRDVEKVDRDASKPVVRHFNFNSSSLPPQHDYLRAILTPWQHRKPQKSWTKIYLSTGYTLSTWDQKTPLISLIYSQIHVTDHISTNGKAPHTLI